MQNESYLEESVSMSEDVMRKSSSKSTIFMVLSIVSISIAAACLILFILSSFAFWIALIPLVGFLVLYFVFKNKKNSVLMECDYIFVDGSLRIAKVLNGQSRKALAVIDCKDIISAGKIDSENFKHNIDSKEYTKIVATPNYGFSIDGIYYLVFNGKTGKSVLIFQPSNVMMLNISKASKKNIFSS